MNHFDLFKEWEPFIEAAIERDVPHPLLRDWSRLCKETVAKRNDIGGATTQGIGLIMRTVDEVCWQAKIAEMQAELPRGGDGRRREG